MGMFHCKCGKALPSRQSFRVSGAIPYADECPGCNRDLNGVGTLAEEGETDSTSRTAELLRRIRGE